MKTATDSKIHLFTLIELLVVIAIIAILASMLLPALNRARNNAQAAACMGNMKQHATAILSYAGTYNDYLPTAQIKDYGDGGWSVQLVDFLGIKTTLKDSRTGLPSVRDSQMARGVFRCPAFREETTLLVGGSLPSGDDNPGSIYGAIGYGANYIYTQEHYKLTKVKSPSLKVYLGDTIDWGTSSAHLRLLFGGTSAYVPSPSVGNRHNGGVNIVLCDGHVEHFKQNELIQPYNGKWMYRYFYDDNPSY